MKALSRPLLGPEIKKSDMAQSGAKGIQCTELLAFFPATSEVLPTQGTGHNYHQFRALACWLAVLRIAALRSIALAISSVYLLVSSFAAETGVRIAIILSYGIWALILSLGATIASALQSLLHA